MKALKIFRSLLLGLAVLAASSALAADKGSLTVFHPATVGGQQLQPGSYKLQWEGNGPDIQLSILKGKSVVVTTPARIVTRDRPAPDNATATKSNADGSLTISQIQLHGKKFALDLGGEPAQTASAGDKK